MILPAGTAPSASVRTLFWAAASDSSRNRIIPDKLALAHAAIASMLELIHSTRSTHRKLPAYMAGLGQSESHANFFLCYGNAG